MKRTIQLLLVLVLSANVYGSPGYHINLNMPGFGDSLVYLVHYYGQARPRIYITDSVTLDRNGKATFNSSAPDFKGGIYIVLVKDTNHTNFEILLDKGASFSVFTSAKTLPDGVTFKGSAENDRFMQYLDYMKEFGRQQEQLKDDLKNAVTAADTAAVRARATVSAKERLAYTANYTEKYPGTLLATIFNAMEQPEVPTGKHLKEDGVTTDSSFAYRYYKTHFWDKFNFRDDRLIFTPIYDGKIEEYISKLVVQWPDSLKAACDLLLANCKGTRDMFHYTLFWLTRYAESSKVMGMDEVFVYLVENYYMKGDAFWLSDEELAKYIDRAKAIAPNVIGNIAPLIKLPDVFTGKTTNMNELAARYTLVLFYSPSCGHCEHELPLLDSVYEAVLKPKGVKVFTVATEGDKKAIADFLVKKKLDKKWTHTYDPDHTSDYHNKYDIYSTPTIYLLDKKKIIRGKRLDHSNIAGLVEMLEKKERAD